MRAIAFSLLLFATTAHADKAGVEQAKQHFATAQRMFEAQLYTKAAEEIQQAYVLDPRPEYLYALGQAFRLAGDCTKAITAYERYLKTKPAKSEVDKATVLIDQCKAKPVEPPKDPIDKPIDKPVDKPLPPPQPPVREHPPSSPGFYADVLGDVLVGGGVVLGVIGIVEYKGALSDLDQADDAVTLDARRDLEDSAHDKRLLSIGFTIGGVAMIGAGIARFVLHDRKGPTVAVVPAHDGGVVTWSGRW